MLKETDIHFTNYIDSADDLINNFDSSQIIQEISVILGGKGGGGRKDLAQAGASNLENINLALNKIKESLSF